MKIKSLKREKKGLSRVIFEDGTEILLDSELIEFKNLSSKSEIDDIEKLLFESDLKRAKSRALWYLSRRDHSEKELMDKLIKAGFSKEASLLAIERMGEMGLVDDRAFAKRLYEQLVVSGNSSAREATHKLKLKGIKPEIIKEVLEESFFDESENIKLLIKKKYQNKLNSEEGVQKVFAALVRKGFSFSDVRRALKEYSEELECEDF